MQFIAPILPGFDTFLTPAMFWLFGRRAALQLLDDKDAEAL